MSIAVGDTSDQDSMAKPKSVTTMPPITNGSATAHMVEILASYRLKKTVPRAQENAEPTPNATPTGDMLPKMLPELTATMPEKPSTRPMILAYESDSPKIVQASSPTSTGCKYSNTAAVPDGKCRIARV